MSRDHLDLLMDQLLRELLGGDRPRDMTARVLARARQFDRVRRTWWISAGAALAACLALAATLWQFWPQAYPEPAGFDVQVVDGGPIRRQARIVNPTDSDHDGQVVLGNYVHVDVAPGTIMTIGGRKFAEQVVLEQGVLDVAVNKKRGTFDVLVGPASVQVVGTRFRVAAADAWQDGAKVKELTVNVTEGRVFVHTPGKDEELAVATGLTSDTFRIPTEPVLAAGPLTRSTEENPAATEAAVAQPETTASRLAEPPRIVSATRTESQPTIIGSAANHPDLNRGARGAPATALAEGPRTHPAYSGTAARGSTTAPRAGNAALAPLLTTRAFQMVTNTGTIQLPGILTQERGIYFLENPRGVFLLLPQPETAAALIGKRVRVVFENGRAVSIAPIQIPATRPDGLRGERGAILERGAAGAERGNIR